MGIKRIMPDGVSDSCSKLLEYMLDNTINNGMVWKNGLDYFSTEFKNIQVSISKHLGNIGGNMFVYLENKTYISTFDYDYDDDALELQRNIRQLALLVNNQLEEIKKNNTLQKENNFINAINELIV